MYCVCRNDDIGQMAFHEFANKFRLNLLVCKFIWVNLERFFSGLY